MIIGFASVRMKLPATPAAVKFSRRLVSYALGLWDLRDMEESATLVVSELVTNAVRAVGINMETLMSHTHDGFAVVGVQVWVHHGRLIIDVWDSSPKQPVMKHPNDWTEGGRGLMLVDVLAERWDVWHPEDGGKVVFAEMPIDHPLNLLREPSPVPEDVRAGLLLASGRERLMAELALETRLLEALAKL